MKNFVLSLNKKTKQHCFSYFHIAPKYYKSIMTNPFNIILDNFGTWLLGYRIEFSCLYIPQEHYFISTLWLWSIDEYVRFWFWVKVHLWKIHGKLIKKHMENCSRNTWKTVKKIHGKQFKKNTMKTNQET